MRSYAFCILITTLLACSHTVPPTRSTAPPPDSEALIALLVDADYDAVESSFDGPMKAAVPTTKLSAAWSALAHDRGKFIAIQHKRTFHDAAGMTDICLLGFAHGPAEVIVNWNANANAGRVSGLFIHVGDLRSHALSLAELMLRGDASALYEQFSPAMKNALPLDRFTAVLTRTRDALGANAHVEGIGVAAPSAMIEEARIPCRGDSGAVDLMLAFKRGSDELQGLHILPAGAGKPDPGPPPYADASRYHEVAVEVTTPGRAPLSATLSLPNASAPVAGAVLVHGSGPHDRDETVLANRPFRDLALGLATRGIAVLRYEKRTYGSNLARLTDASTFDEETTDDAVAAAQLLLRTQTIDPKRVFIVGHSQGAMAAPRIAAREPKLRGLVMLAPPARPLEDLILDQNRYLAELRPAAKTTLAEVEAQVDRLKAPTLASENPTTLVLGAPVSWWRSLHEYAPVEQLQQLAKPTLILQGDRDYQVTNADLALWKAAVSGKAWASVRELPALNHLLEAGNGPPTPAEYMRPGHVDESAVSAIADWIAAQP
jgi:pimeloyl-ACP methyl ester carboxylesterase